MLAKTVTTLDVVSRRPGRCSASAPAGSSWSTTRFGFEFGTFTERFEKLEEALQIIGADAARRGAHVLAARGTRCENAINNPRLRPTIPIMIGGSGEKKTLRLVAQYADHMNIICGRRTSRARSPRCGSAARRSAATRHAADELSSRSVVLAESRRADDAPCCEQVPPDRRERVFLGTLEQVAEDLKTDVLDQGINGLTDQPCVNGHVPGAVAALGKALLPLLS